jgi:hypothetical protein
MSLPSPELQKAEREALLHVEVLEPGVVFYREVRRMTPQTVRAMQSRIEEVTRGEAPFAFVLDVSDTERPDAAARQELFRVGPRLVSRLVYLAAVVRGNVVTQAMVQVFALTTGLPSFSVHETLEEAIDAARRSLRHP